MILEEVTSKKAQGISFQEVSLFETVENSQFNLRSDMKYERFRIDQEKYDKFLREQPRGINLQLSYNNQALNLSLVEVEIRSPEFRVTTSSGNNNFNYDQVRFYRGIVEGDNNSVVAISFTKDDVIGVIDIDGDENLVFGSLSDTPRFKEFVLYDINQIQDTPDFGCELIEGVSDYLPDSRTEIDTRNAINCVNIYFECEYDMFTVKLYMNCCPYENDSKRLQDA